MSAFSNHMRQKAHYRNLKSVPDLPIGYIGLSLGPPDPRGPPTNCGMHRAVVPKLWYAYQWWYARPFCSSTQKE